MLTAMVGVHGLTAGVHVVAGGTAIESASATLFIGSLLLLCWLAPNTQEIARYHGPPGADTPLSAHDALLRWRPTPAWGVAVACLFALALMNLSKVSEFLYFQF